MSWKLSSAAVVIGALRVNDLSVPYPEWMDKFNVERKAKIRYQYNQVPYLTQNTKLAQIYHWEMEKNGLIFWWPWPHFQSHEVNNVETGNCPLCPIYLHEMERTFTLFFKVTRGKWLSAPYLLKVLIDFNENVQMHLWRSKMFKFYQVL